MSSNIMQAISRLPPSASAAQLLARCQQELAKEAHRLETCLEQSIQEYELLEHEPRAAATQSGQLQQIASRIQLLDMQVQRIHKQMQAVSCGVVWIHSFMQIKSNLQVSSLGLPNQSNNKAQAHLRTTQMLTGEIASLHHYHECQAKKGHLIQAVSSHLSTIGKLKQPCLRSYRSQWPRINSRHWPASSITRM